MTILILVIGVLLFIGLIISHEFGHFIMARRNGVEVEEFGIFFPPAIYKRKTKDGWVFSINALPLGGFVKLKGEHDSDKQKGSYGAASLWVKTKIMLAGVTMNLITALVLLTIISLIGMPEVLANQFKVASNTKTNVSKVLVGYVEPGSPAYKIGLKSDDQLISIGKVGSKQLKITSASTLPSLTKSLASQKVNIYFLNNHKLIKKTTPLLSLSVVGASQSAYLKKIKSTKLDCLNVTSPKGYLGITANQYMLERSTWAAPINAVGFSIQATVVTFAGLGHALGGLGSAIAGIVSGNSVVRANGVCRATSEVTGPVGIAIILKDSASLGFTFMLFVIAIISLTLAIMNLLPVPALDGGRLWMTLFTHAIKKPLSPKREEAIVAGSMIILICLFILITISDVHRFL